MPAVTNAVGGAPLLACGVEVSDECNVLCRRAATAPVLAQRETLRIRALLLSPDADSGDATSSRCQRPCTAAGSAAGSSEIERNPAAYQPTSLVIELRSREAL